jgi:7-alpha-hydroxysteroid dehydrogenase
VTGRLDGRAAIVTGASRGLGRAIALALASEGAAVAVVGRTENVWDERLPGTIGETVADIESAGGRAVAIRADLLDRDDIAQLVAQARDALGPITILVNNAAFTAPGRPPKPGDPDVKARAKAAKTLPGAAKPGWPPLLGTPLGAYRRHFEIAVFAAYELIQLVCPDMIAADSGSIVNITSAASRLPGDGPYLDRSGGVLPGYGGSKAALEHLTWCAAYDLQGHNIAVNALSPSKPIMTPGLSYYAPDFDDVAQAEEFAQAAVELALADPEVVTGRTIGHLQVLDGSFRSFQP